MRRAILSFVLLASACAGSQGAASSPVGGSNAVTLAWQPEYLGSTADSCTVFSECLRGPAFNTNVPVSQSGNPSTFTVTSSDSSVTGATIIMTGPSAESEPAVEPVPHKAGNAVLTVTGANGSSATLPVTITTISKMTIALSGLPSASVLLFSVSAPASASCPSFEGGYSFQWDVAASRGPTVIENFPAMGNGPLSACIFSTVSITVSDASNAKLASKTVQLPIAVGQDNPSAISVP